MRKRPSTPVAAAACLLAALVFPPFALSAQDASVSRPVVRLATLTDYAPIAFDLCPRDKAMEFLPPGTSPTCLGGLAVDIVVASLHAAGYSVELYVAQWPRVMAMLDERRVDAVFPAVRTTDRESRYAFSAEFAYPPNEYVAYAADARPLDWKGLESLDGLRVGIMRGFSFGPRWEAYAATGRAAVVPYETLDQGFELLERGRLDAVLGYRLTYDYHLETAGIRSRFVATEPFDESRSFLMARRDEAGKAALEAFDRGKRELRKDGAIQEILRRWKAR